MQQDRILLTTFQPNQIIPLIFDGMSVKEKEGYRLFLKPKQIHFGMVYLQDDQYVVHFLETFDVSKMKEVHLNFRCEPFHSTEVLALHHYEHDPRQEIFLKMSYLGIMFSFEERICRFKVRNVRKSYPILKTYFASHRIPICSNLDIDKELSYSDEELYETYVHKKGVEPFTYK